MDLQEKSQLVEKENNLNLVNVSPKNRQILERDLENDEITKKLDIAEVLESVNCDNTENCSDKPRNEVITHNTVENEVSNLIDNNSSDCESEQNNEVTFKKKTKRIAILDSDSEEESNTDVNASFTELLGDGKEHLNRVESYSSENHSNSPGSTNLKDNGNEENNETKTKQKKRLAILDSDSDEEPVTPHNKSFNKDVDAVVVSSDAPVYVVNDKGKLVVENNAEEVEQQKSRIAALCDSESSEDESGYNTIHEDPSEFSLTNKKRSRAMKTSKPKEEPLEKKMTAKEALQQRQEIRSESQRMTRESKVSLPYHKPKTHSIKEFLQNRPRLSLSLLRNNNTPPSLAMKMSTQELEIVTKKLEQRKKEVQEFYKSESDSDEEVTEGDGPAENDSDGKEINDNNALLTNNESDSKVKEQNEEISPEKSNNEELDRQVECVRDGIAEAVDVQVDGNSLGVKEMSDINKKNQTEEEINVKMSCANIEDQESTSDKTEKPQEPPVAELECSESENVLSIQPMIPEEEDITKSPSLNTNATEAQQEECEHSDSVEYDFDLNDFDNNTKIPEKDASEPKETNPDEEHLQRLLRKYDFVDNDCDQSATKKLNKFDVLKQVGSAKPRLSGGPDQEIDLEEGVAKPSGVAQLMQRFMQHALKKNVAKSKVQLDIINLTQGEVRRETVAMSVDPEEEPVAILEKPGEKLQKLRNELQHQMAQRRSELWQQKHQPINDSEKKEVCDDEKSECGADEDILDDEEEAELTDIEDTEEEDEYEDIERREKPRKKSEFIDEEAEESDEEECDGVSPNDVNDENEEFEEEQEELQSNSKCPTVEAKKPLRRILKGFTEDSDEDESNLSILDPPESQDIEETRNQDTSLNTTDTWDDDLSLPPNRLRIDKTPHKEITQAKLIDLDLLSPVVHLTGLEKFNSESKFLLDDSLVSPFTLPPDLSESPLKNKSRTKEFQKKLFAGSCEALDSEANMESIAQLCSGKFPEVKSPVGDTVTTQDLVSVCSGSFSGIKDTFTVAATVGENVTTQDLINVCSGSFSGFTGVVSTAKESKENPTNIVPENQETQTKNLLENKHTSVKLTQLKLNTNDEVKDLDQDFLISQLLDEEEMEEFKKRFESPIALTFNKSVVENKSETEVQGGGRLVSDSSDDEDEQVKNKASRKKRQKRLAFSDDESDSENEEDEKIDLRDGFSEDEFENDNAVIDYDSEENEIEFDNQNDAPKQNMKTSEFFENEAELSESDWDSADEDEKGLDALEIEQGDAEVFDENKMRSDLEKIHMRRVLDDDNREIKILQELLLEDGELHGTGRQRQFRWRNIDVTGNEDEGARDTEVEAYLDEEESEEQWRRSRHQREMFLKKKQEKHDSFVSEDSNSQVLKLGQEVVRKSLSAVVTATEKPKAAPSSPEVKKPLMLLNTRGSFLSRTDKFLNRLAEFTKVTNSSVLGGSKNAKKIVFQTVGNSTNDGNIQEAVLNDKKRKIGNGDGTPTIIKKLRLSSTMTPVAKSVNKKKQLFK